MKITKRQHRAISGIIYDLFAVAIPINSTEKTQSVPDKLINDSLPGLPTESELSQLFNRFNYEYFAGRLPSVKISYSNRMINAGQYTPAKKEIKIGRRYHEIFLDEIEDTLKHEMIHLIHCNHGAKFKQMARKIGASIRAKTDPRLRGPYKYLYVCPACGKEYPRRKQLRMAFCGNCCKNSKAFNPGHKLSLKESPVNRGRTKS